MFVFVCFSAATHFGASKKTGAETQDKMWMIIYNNIIFENLAYPKYCQLKKFFVFSLIKIKWDRYWPSSLFSYCPTQKRNSVI